MNPTPVGEHGLLQSRVDGNGHVEEQARSVREKGAAQHHRQVIDIDAEWAEWYSRHPEADKKRKGSKCRRVILSSMSTSFKRTYLSRLHGFGSLR